MAATAWLESANEFLQQDWILLCHDLHVFGECSECLESIFQVAAVIEESFFWIRIEKIRATNSNAKLTLTWLSRLYFVLVSSLASLRYVVSRLAQCVPIPRSIRWPLKFHPNSRRCIWIDRLVIDQILPCNHRPSRVLVVQRMQPNGL